MAFQVSNQVPADLDCNYARYQKLNQDGNPLNLISQNISQKIFTNKNTVIKYKGKNVTPDDVTDLVQTCLTDKLDPQAESMAKTLFNQTINDYPVSPLLPFRTLYSVIAGSQSKLPLPKPTLVYTINTDLIPAAKNYLAGKISKANLFANFAYTLKAKTLAFAFKDTNEFLDFKTNTIGPLITLLKQNPNVPSSTLAKLADFQKLTLSDLTENLELRNNDVDDQDPFSFSRVIVNSLIKSKAITMPFDVGELYNPKTIILINIDQHAHSLPNNVKNCWRKIKDALAHPVKVISTHKLTKLSSTSQYKNTSQLRLKQMQKQAQQNHAARTAIKPLSTTRPTQATIFKRVAFIMKHMQNVNSSMNIYKVYKRSFNKANRRHPDNFNLPGKIVSTQYRPDLHIYLDTSGSISESNYENGIKSCIYMAKKLDVDLYFNSFSHIISQEVKIPIRGKSTAEIYSYFQLVPKVTGGTDFSNVWRYINKSKRRKRELALMITDFGDYAPNEDFVHPKNLYYVAIDNYDYNSIYHMAKNFLQSMANSGHPIRNQVLL